MLKNGAQVSKPGYNILILVLYSCKINSLSLHKPERRLPSCIWDAAVSTGCLVAAFDCRPAAYYVVRRPDYLRPRHDRPLAVISCFSAQHRLRQQQPALCGHIPSLSHCYHATLSAVGISHSTQRWPEVYSSSLSCDQATLRDVGTLGLASVWSRTALLRALALALVAGLELRKSP